MKHPNIIDISHSLSSETPAYPGDIATELLQVRRYSLDGYNAYTLNTSLHTGTHVDAPMHLTDDDRFISEFLPEHFIGTGVLLDVRGMSTIEMNDTYSSMIEENQILLLYSGFDQKYGEQIYFTDHPVLSESFSKFLVSKKIKLLGIDFPSPDKEPYNIHKILLSNGIFILENLTNLESIFALKSFEVIAVPLKISAEASPVRAFCRKI